MRLSKIQRIFIVSLLLFMGLFCRAHLAHAVDLNQQWPMHVISDVSDGGDGIKLDDINHDGLLDIATGWEEGGVTTVSLNPGPDQAKNRWPTVKIGTSPNAEDAVFGDLDGDSKLDVVSSSEGNTQDLFIFWGPSIDQLLTPSAWQKEALTPARNMTRWMYAQPVQLDDENGLDIVAGSKDNNAMIGWWEAPADPHSMNDWKWHKLADAHWIMSIEMVDMDGDGDLDILFSDRVEGNNLSAGGSKWLENPGPTLASGAWPLHQITHELASARFLVVGDLDGDGLQDVVTASDTKIIISRRLSADGLQWQETVLDTPTQISMAKGAAIADVDHDGKQDILISSNGQADLVIWLSYNQSPFSTDWTVHTLSGHIGIKGDQLRLVDLDQDGDLDAITTEEKVLQNGKKGLGIIWFENPFGAGGTTTYSVADINHDGKVNLVDYSILSSQLLQTGPNLSADLNQDQTVNLLDFSILVRELTI